MPIRNTQTEWFPRQAQQPRVWARQVPQRHVWVRETPQIIQNHFEFVCYLDFGPEKIMLKPNTETTYPFRYQGHASFTRFDAYFFSHPPTLGIESPNRIYNDIPEVSFLPERPSRPDGNWKTGEMTITTGALLGEIYALFFME